jgi:CheY-like chemotaxis protein
LLVEDSEDVRESACALLEENGNTVSCAANGREALDWLSANEPPCLILLDLNMPEMNGFEFAEELSRHPSWSEIPIVVMTASSTARGLELRAREFLAKPYAIEKLLRTTRHCARHASPDAG